MRRSVSQKFEYEIGRSNGEKAMMLNRIMMLMNDERAYDEWILLFPDGETLEEAELDFKHRGEINELTKYFIRIYRKYHEGGINTHDKVIIEAVHKIDRFLSLGDIEVSGEFRIRH